MKFIITGPWLPAVHRRGYVIEHGQTIGTILELLVVGQFKGQVVSVPDTWLNRGLVYCLDIHFDVEGDRLSRVP